MKPGAKLPLKSGRVKKDSARNLLVASGLSATPAEAERLIMAGMVFIKTDPSGPGRRVEKAGDLLPEDAALFVKGRERFVSRGGYKLLGALEHFGLDVSGLVCLDAGASTGGFTDCLLQHGAARVYAVDVGPCQLHERLLGDARVRGLYKVNLRLAPPDLLPEKVEFMAADLSFISLTVVLPASMAFLRPGAKVLALIKPQFELGAAFTDKGVVRDEQLRRQAVAKVVDFAEANLPLVFLGVAPAAIKGPKGNQEYTALWQFVGSDAD